MANLATRVAAAVGAMSSKRRKLYLVLFVLTARVWIDETTASIHRSRDVDERLTELEAEHAARFDHLDAAVNRAHRRLRELDPTVDPDADQADVAGAAPYEPPRLVETELPPEPEPA